MVLRLFRAGNLLDEKDAALVLDEDVNWFCSRDDDPVFVVLLDCGIRGRESALSNAETWEDLEL